MNNKHIRLLASKFDIVLASRSPRRVELLKEIGIEFKQVIPRLNEIRQTGESPYDFAERLAKNKALWATKKMKNNQLAIGCDTIVVLENMVLGKPTDETDALQILSVLSGNQHTVCTALAITDTSNILASGYELTKVFFHQVSNDKLKEYIATGEPMDKAGAYGIQGMGSFLVDRIDGNLDNVIGFPRKLLEKLTRKIIENF